MIAADTNVTGDNRILNAIANPATLATIDTTVKINSLFSISRRFNQD